MTKQEFIKGYQQKSGLTDKQMTEFLKGQIVQKCDCGMEGCKGWAIETDTKKLLKERRLAKCN